MASPPNGKVVISAAENVTDLKFESSMKCATEDVFNQKETVLSSNEKNMKYATESVLDLAKCLENSNSSHHTPKSLEEIQEAHRISPIEKLSDDELLIVFGKLSFPDIHRRCALVCKAWKDLSRKERFGPKCVTNWDKSLSDGFASATKNFNRVIQRVNILNYYAFEADEVIFLAKLLADCERLQKLTLYDCQFFEFVDVFFATAIPIKRTLKSVEIIKKNSCLAEYEIMYVKEALRFISESNVDELTLEWNGMVEGCALPTNLKKLDISADDYFEEARAFFKALVNANKSTLVELRVRFDVDNEFVAIVRQCERLRYFSVGSRCYDLSTFVKNLTNLYPLECEFIKWNGLLVPVDLTVNADEWTFYKNANSLKILFVPGDDISVDYVNSSADNMAFNFPRLTKLVYSDKNHHWNERFNQDFALKIASKFSGLKVFKIGLPCERIRFGFWRRAMRELPALKEVIILRWSVNNDYEREYETLKIELAKVVPLESYTWSLERKPFWKYERNCAHYYRFAVQRKTPSI